VRLMTAVMSLPLVAACVQPQPRKESVLDPTGVTGSPASLVAVSRPEYRADEDSEAVRVTIVARLANRTDDTLRVHPCRQRPPYPPVVGLIRLHGGTSTVAWGPFCTGLLLRDPPKLPPGAERVDTIQVIGWRSRNQRPNFAPGPVDGTYRLAYRQVYRTWHPYATGPTGQASPGELLPDSVLTSGPFRIIGSH
jgi:hypothetical protein